MADDSGDRVTAAMDELYALDPAAFTARRNGLAAAARKSGADAAAKQIAGLRRPTRAAAILNRFVRVNATVAHEFDALGARLREAHRTLDGDQIRELTRQRRQLIDQTATLAFAAAGLSAQTALPSAALRDEVSATLGAVLADEAVARQFSAGALVTAADQSGFGPSGAHLSAVPTPAEPATRPAPKRPTSAAQTRQAREQSRREAAVAKAEQEVQARTEDKRAADDAVKQATASVRALADQLADAKRREDDAFLDARHAELQLRKATKALRDANR